MLKHSMKELVDDLGQTALDDANDLTSTGLKFDHFKKYSKLYKRTLYDNVIPFWVHSCEDPDGGFFTHLDEKGVVFLHDRYTEMQGKMVFPHFIDFSNIFYFYFYFFFYFFIFFIFFSLFSFVIDLLLFQDLDVCSSLQ